MRFASILPQQPSRRYALHMLSERLIKAVIAVSVTLLGVMALLYQFFPGVFTP